MTTRPRLKLGRHLLPGVVAVGLFATMAYVFASSTFDEHAGFPDANITAHIGYALFNVDPKSVLGPEAATIPGEGFLVAFEIVDVVLVAALVGAVVLARRDEGGTGVRTALRPDEETETPDEEPARADGGREGGDR